MNKYAREADQVLALDDFEALSDDELRAKTKEFQEALKNGKTPRTISNTKLSPSLGKPLGEPCKQKPFKVQVVGALVLK
jgi:preprotein translocase subunit SecA